MTTRSIKAGQWLWFNWQSGQFRHQRSAVRFQLLSKKLFNICSLSTVMKRQNSGKEARNGALKTMKANCAFREFVKLDCR